MEYLLILASLGSDGGLTINVQQSNLTLSQCEALITNPGQSCEADTTTGSIVFHQGVAVLLPRCKGQITDNCAFDERGYYLIDGRAFILE